MKFNKKNIYTFHSYFSFINKILKLYFKYYDSLRTVKK